MSLPGEEELEVPILQAISALGGEANTKEIYQKVATFFPGISQEELERRVKTGDKAWANKIRWAKFLLVQKEEVISPRRGVWRITEKGKERVRGSK